MGTKPYKYYSEFKAYCINKLGNRCVACGESNISNLEIDHINWETKEFPISKEWSSRSLEEINLELKKCQCLCSFHHLEKSKKDLSKIAKERGFIHGTKFGWMRTKCKCEICDKSRKEYHIDRNSKRRKTTTGGRQAYNNVVDHGEIRCYYRGCRCPLCKAANATVKREQRLQKKLK